MLPCELASDCPTSFSNWQWFVNSLGWTARGDWPVTKFPLLTFGGRKDSLNQILVELFCIVLLTYMSVWAAGGGCIRVKACRHNSG